MRSKGNQIGIESDFCDPEIVSYEHRRPKKGAHLHVPTRFGVVYSAQRA